MRTSSGARWRASATRSWSATATPSRSPWSASIPGACPWPRRLAALIGEFTGSEPALGSLDIALYRDDVGVGAGRRHAVPVVGVSELDFDVAGRAVVLVDDVLYTGRTIRAAIDALFDYGRPAQVQLAVLVDRGHRELPIRPDYVGKNLPTARGERVSVRLTEIDGADEILLEREEEDA